MIVTFNFTLTTTIKTDTAPELKTPKFFLPVFSKIFSELDVTNVWPKEKLRVVNCKATFQAF